MAWLYIFIAALFESAWTFSLKFMRFGDIKTLRFTNFYKTAEGLPILLPLLGYIVFGVGNIYFFSMAMKRLPMATTYAVWTAATLVFIKFSEVMFFKQRITWLESLFILLIMSGILGLKFYGTQVK
ncbi:MAG TPA: SMR family transporter [Mucilaginibacter sp.]|nr:SMR family transporter [Mucilaginibacter sp.]HVW16556.1 SMR family transporter [Mucilaginibacter sp.]